MMNHSETYLHWKAGVLESAAALHVLLRDLSEVESDLGVLNAEREAIRSEISELVAALGGKATEGGYRLEIRSASVVTSYDKAKLDDLIASLRETGLIYIADEIAACTKTSARAGGLTITPLKQP